MGTNLLRFSWSFSVLLAAACFSDPGELPQSASGSSTSLSEPEDADGSTSGCDGVIDACGVCDGSGSPCFGCTVPQATNFEPLADAYDGTCTCAANGTPLMDASQSETNMAGGGLSEWQSFTSERGGGLHSISIDLSSPLGEQPAPATLNVYQGEGTLGTRIISMDIEIEGVQLHAVQEFEFPDLVPIALGEMYTWELTTPMSTFGFFWWDNRDPYAGGQFSGAEGSDAAFRVDVVTCAAEE